MKSTRIKPSFRLRRGNAEFELVISCIILLSILFIVAGAMKIGVARMNATQTASYEAFHNATEDSTPLYTDNPAAQPLDGIATIRPTLPNRLHAQHPTTQVSGLTGGNGTTFTANVGAQAAVLAPNWNYSAYPVGASDQALLQTWFEDYVNESHADIKDSLGLSAPWTP